MKLTEEQLKEARRIISLANNRKRWGPTTKEERVAHSRVMLEGRRKKLSTVKLEKDLLGDSEGV